VLVFLKVKAFTASYLCHHMIKPHFLFSTLLTRHIVTFAAEIVSSSINWKQNLIIKA